MGRVGTYVDLADAVGDDGYGLRWERLVCSVLEVGDYRSIC